MKLTDPQKEVLRGFGRYNRDRYPIKDLKTSTRRAMSRKGLLRLDGNDVVLTVKGQLETRKLVPYSKLRRHKSILTLWKRFLQSPAPIVAHDEPLERSFGFIDDDVYHHIQTFQVRADDLLELAEDVREGIKTASGRAGLFSVKDPKSRGQ